MTPRTFSFRLSLFNGFLYLGAGMQLPFLPLWLKDRGLAPSEIALVVAAMTAVRILSIPAGTLIADRFGNRRLIVIGAAAASFAFYLAMGFMPGFYSILALAVLAGAMFSPVGPLTEVLAVEGSSHHGIDYGRIRLWASISFLSGSLAAGALLEIVPIAWVIFFIAVCQGGLALAATALPPDPAQAMPEEGPFRVAAIMRFLASGSFVIFLAATSIAQASHGFMYAFGSVHWDHLGYGKLTIGSLWAAAVLTEISMFAFSNYFLGLLGPARLIVVGITCGLVRWVVTGFDPPLWLLFPAMMLHVGSFALTHLGTMHYIRQAVPAGMRNSAQGLYAALAGGILMSLAMWSAGPLYAAFGGLAYFFMAGMSAVALGLALALSRLNPRAEPPAAA
ncbi:MAG: MFS transporter [Alphaproteobacteria bacterium]|nr:MFS transporter [Alphaproteobacteria bacterium]